MNSKSSIRLLSVVAAGAAVTMGACVAQPVPPCQVAQGVQLVIGLPQFWVQYKLLTGTGSCSMLPGEEVGFQTYSNPTDDTDLKVAIRASTLGGYYGSTAEGTIDPVPRVDPTDPEGKKINSVVKLTPFPDPGYVCKADGDIPEAVQNFQEEMIVEDLEDGGTSTTTLPAMTMKYKWSNAEWMSSPAVPGQAFHANLQFTQDTCVATYEATGIWPWTHCETDLDCSPVPVPDAGDNDISDPTRRQIGSGLNPAFTVKCDTAVGACVLGIPWDEFKAQQAPK